MTFLEEDIILDDEIVISNTLSLNKIKFKKSINENIKDVLNNDIKKNNNMEKTIGYCVTALNIFNLVLFCLNTHVIYSIVKKII